MSRHIEQHSWIPDALPKGRGFSVCLLAIYVIGCAYIAMLPPWEGYDEVAHYSYAQELAESGRMPRLGSAYLSDDVERYMQHAPMPYGTVPPFDRGLGDYSYVEWFGRAGERLSLPFLTPESPRRFQSGRRENWQAQHPPLYYLLIAPLVLATADFSWAAQLGILRVASWTLAFLGFALSVSASARAAPPQVEPSVRSLSLLWPVLYPEFFPEFARIGNDSLVLLLIGVVWALAVEWCTAPQRWHGWAAMGLALGLGGVTKITFMPLAGAIAVWMIWLALREPAGAGGSAVGGALLSCLIFGLTSFWWYAGNLVDQGSLTGLADLSTGGIAGSASWLGALAQPVEILRGLAGMALSFAWGGSTSSAYPPIAAVLPLVLTGTLLLAASCRPSVLARMPAVGLAVLMATALLGGLLYYLLCRISATGIGAGAPGWYFHVLAGPLVLLMGMGWQRLSIAKPGAACLARVVVVYALVFSMAMAWMQLSLFTGCTYKTAASRYYSSDSWGCLFDWPSMLERMSYLAWPKTAALLACFAAILLIRFAPSMPSRTGRRR